MAELLMIEYYPDSEDLEIQAAIEAMEEAAEDPNPESIEIQGWFSSLKKIAKKAVKKVAKTVVPSPIRKVLSVADKATGGILSNAAKSALPAALSAFTSINPVTGAIMKVSTKMFDELDTLGKAQGKKVAFSGKAAGNIARTFYSKGQNDAEMKYLKRIAAMDKQQLKILRDIAKNRAPQIVAAQQQKAATVAQAQSGYTTARTRTATKSSVSRSRKRTR